MSEAKVIEAMRSALAGKDELIEALTQGRDAWKGVAEGRKQRILALEAELAEAQKPLEGLIRRREDCPRCANCPCAETD